MSELKIYFVTPNKDAKRTNEVHKFLKFVKEKGEVSITPIGPFSDDPATGMTFLRDSLNHADVVVLCPGTGRDVNEELYFVAGIAYGFGIPIVGMGPDFCEFSFLAPKQNGGEPFESSEQIYPVHRVFESGSDNYEVLLQTIVKAANTCVSVTTNEKEEDKAAFHIEEGKEVSEREYRERKNRKVKK